MLSALGPSVAGAVVGSGRLVVAASRRAFNDGAAAPEACPTCIRVTSNRVQNGFTVGSFIASA